MLNGLVTRGRVVHYLEIFAAASIVYAAANYDHILGAHGLNAAKSLAVGAAAAGCKAVLEAWRKATRPAVVPALSVRGNNLVASATANTSWAGPLATTYTIPPAVTPAEAKPAETPPALTPPEQPAPSPAPPA